MNSRPATRRSGLGYLAGLDGLRAVAVSMVFLFHAGVVDGGFIGVDVFFVISGFLITGLAIDEIERTGSLGLAAFWGRRARRLLPALFLLCAAVVGWSVIDRPAPARLDRDVVSTLLYVANWSRVGSGDEYFAAYDDPSLLEHTWSLAVEEQFYVVWPLVIVGAVWVGRRLGWSARNTIGVVAGATAITSTCWAWWLAASRGTGLNRLYFGTDTRAVGLAIGCVAACLLARGASTGARRTGPISTAAALGAAATLAVLTVTLDGTERWLYGPGFALIAIASIVLVVTASATGPVAAALGAGPLAAMGRVSYGIYLWHWPVIVVLNADRTGLGGITLGVVWVAGTAILTIASWWLVERRAPLPTMLRPGRGAAYGAVCLVVGAASIVVTRTNDGSTDDAGALVLPRDAAGPESEPDPATPAELDATADRPDVDAPDRPAPSAAPAPTAAPTVATRAAPDGRPLRVLVLGDSVAESLEAAPDDLTTVRGVDVEVVNGGIVACPVIWEGRWVFDDGRIIEDPPACDAADRFADTVDAVDPDLIVMMFAWGGTIAGRELADGTVAAACDASFDRAFGDAYAELVDRFDDDAVVIVTSVARPTDFRDDAQADRPDCLNAEIARRGFATFDFDDWLCPDLDCEPALPLMRDTVHFADTAEVRALVWPALLAEFMVTAKYLEPAS